MINEKFWLAIAFLTFLVLIIKFVWPIIARALDNKSKAIAEEILAAKELKENAQNLLNKAEQYYKESVTFAEKIIKDAEAESQKMAQEAKENLENEIKRRTAVAIDRIKLEEERAVREIKTKIVDNALGSLSNNLDLDQKNHENLVNKATNDLEKIIR